MQKKQMKEIYSLQRWQTKPKKVTKALINIIQLLHYYLNGARYVADP